ncbi:unnamed protein product, partial [Scytosiphon promiscuus]
MERGVGGGVAGRTDVEQQHQEDEENAGESPHVGVGEVAQAEVELDTLNRGRRCARAWASSGRVQKWCNLLLLSLVAGFACIFVYAWVEAFRKGIYDQAIGFITVAFFATAVCTCGYRRRMHSPAVTVEEEIAQIQPMRPRNFVEQWVQNQPKGVPLHVRQTFDYFIFMPVAPPKDAAKDDTLATTPTLAGNPTGTAERTASTAAPSKASGILRRVVRPRRQTTQRRCHKAHASWNCSSAAAMAATAGAGIDDDKRDCVSALSPEKQHQLQQGRFSWASSSALTDCSVCLEAYRAGDRVCRLPCAHAFHAACIDTWLDQQHVCPQCRLDLLPPDLSWGRSSQASAAGNPAQFANLFGSPAYGASPLSAVNGMLHHSRRSPEFFRTSRGNSSQHRNVRAGASLAGSPADLPLPYNAYFQAHHQQPHHHQHYLSSPAYTDASPLSTGSSTMLHPARGRTSPQFMTLGIRARGTPVPTGMGHFGMFPAVMPSASFPAPDGGPPSSGYGGAGPTAEPGLNGGGTTRPGIPPTPPRGRHPSASTPSASSLRQHHHHQFRPVPNPAGSNSAATVVASPSPPPLLRLTPRRPRFAGGRSVRPSTPVVLGERCGGSGPLTGGRARSGSGHRRLRLPSLTGGRRRLRSRSNSYDVAPRSRSGSPGMFALGNASPKAGAMVGGGGGLERRFSGTIRSSKRWLTPRRQQWMASWEEVDDVSDVVTRRVAQIHAACRPGSEDWGGSGEWHPGVFERSFRNSSPAAPALTEQRDVPANPSSASASAAVPAET